MRKLLGFLLRIAVLVAVAVWLADRPGTARIVWHDYVIECSAAFLGVAVLVIGFVFYGLARVWHLLRNGPELWRLGRKMQRLEQGQDFLTQGLVAIAGGHAAEAGRLALAARKKLGTTTATLLLQAQAAQMAHDHGSARAIFRAMLENADSATLGYRGLIMEARRGGEWGEVERLSVEIGRLKPAMPWLDWVRFEVATRKQDWDGAGAALANLAPTRLLEPKVLHHHRAALLIATSQEKAKEGDTATALEAAEKAVKEAPEWLPALINLARRQASGDHLRAARRTVEKGWALQPHRQLADILRVGDIDPMEIYKTIERLCRDTDSDPVSHLVLAEAAFAADIWGEARRHVMILVTRHQATQAAYRLLARLERRESGDERAALQWLTKAAEAAPDPAWLCSVCGGGHEDWQATCRACGSFATLEWRIAGVSYVGGQALTPLLCGWAQGRL